MSTVIVRYRPRDDAAEENQALVEAVFAELAASRPDGLRYACFRLGDGTFVHIADVTADPNPLLGIEAFIEFSSTVDDRCGAGDGPDAQPATLVGDYGLVR